MVNRILLVEDDSTIGEVLTATLRSHGYDVAWERTGTAALARAGSGPVDLSLLDLGLPDLDGIEVCRRLRRARPRWTSWWGWRRAPTTTWSSRSGWPSCTPGCAPTCAAATPARPPHRS